MSEGQYTYPGMMPQWLMERRRWRAEMQAMSPVSGEDDSTTDGVPSDEEEEEEKEEGPVEREGRCEKTLREANALIREQNQAISALQRKVNQLQAEVDRERLRALADRLSAEATRFCRLAFNRQATMGARDRQNLDLGKALERRRCNCHCHCHCHCQGRGPRIRRQQCLPAAQPAVRAPRRAQKSPAPTPRRSGRIAKIGERRPYPK